MNKYLPRITDKTLKQYLETFGAVSIVGCKWCGKTTSAAQFAKSVLNLQNPDKTDTYETLVASKPSILLKGEKPRLLDEWQDYPSLWDAVRTDLDATGDRGQYILTGSYTPRLEKPKHPGTGRFGRLEMNPMTLSESNDSSSEVSLSDLLKHRDIAATSPLDIEDYAYLCTRGGWPGALNIKKSNAPLVAKEYLKSLTEEDIFRVADVEYDPRRSAAVLRSLARNNCSDAKLPTLANDALIDNKPISEKVLTEYLKAYNRLFITFEIPAFSPNLRSKYVTRTSKKRFLVDPSLAVAALAASPEKLLEDIHTFGFIFENLCIRDLRIYAQSLGATLKYYKDSSGLEIDAIIDFENGDWGAIEIKLGSDQLIDTAAKNLLNLADSIDPEKTSAPRFLAVVTGTEFAYRRRDGVYILPIGCLS